MCESLFCWKFEGEDQSGFNLQIIKEYKELSFHTLWIFLILCKYIGHFLSIYWEMDTANLKESNKTHGVWIGRDTQGPPNII